MLSVLSALDAAIGNQRSCVIPASAKRASFAGMQAFALGNNYGQMQHSSLWL
jgi:hypothetical protein